MMNEQTAVDADEAFDEEMLEGATQKWYSLKPLLSRGAILSFVIGERSAGKTYAFKEWAFTDFMTSRSKIRADIAAGVYNGIDEYGNKKEPPRPNHWVYLRRNEDEIGLAKAGLWDDFLPERGWEVKSKGIRCYIRPKFVEEIYENLDGKMVKTEPEPWELFGYYLCITDGQSYKGLSFPSVNKLCLDEFIIENKRKLYIPDEVKHFLGILSTVFRRRKAKVVALSNSGAIANPYFRHYGVKSEDFRDTDWVKRHINPKTGHAKVVFEYYRSGRTEDQIMEDDIAQISGEAFLNYAFRNQFSDASEDMVASKPIGAAPFIRFTSDGQTWYTLYSSSKADGGAYWLREINGINAKAFALSPNLVSEETTYDVSAVNRIKALVDAREVYFDSVDTRARFLAEINRI